MPNNNNDKNFYKTLWKQFFPFSSQSHTHTHSRCHIWIENILPKNAKDAVSALAKTQHGTVPTEIGTIESKNDECGATTTIGASLDAAGAPINFILWNEPATNMPRMDIAVKLWICLDGQMWREKKIIQKLWWCSFKNVLSKTCLVKKMQNDDCK